MVDGVPGLDGLSVRSPVMVVIGHVLDFVTILILNLMDKFASVVTLVLEIAMRIHVQVLLIQHSIWYYI